MRQRRPNLNASVEKFTQALLAYHSATAQMHGSLARLIAHQRDFSIALREIVVSTAPAMSHRTGRTCPNCVSPATD
ncbi:hypothetical protein [Propionivibrio dicarboxylicus]|uniref:Uncharacterized protein n=1 Tax=Propionivibrio dicarboxylicus TaxID=83767 RepID=A0A1G7W6R8_9RHOO|nr:hypothetical protein [Propionivibrio dicarboxylicus]SDG67682.1 hypothetical protein SAMN05660652_00428 [Propionivibrio dicarboxylicus]